MQHVAIDLGGKESQICVRSPDGQIIEERKVQTGKLDKLFEQLPHSRIIVETCAEAFKVADQALAHEHEVKVVPALLVRSLGVGARGIKTDRRDAQILSEVSCRIDLPSVHVPSELARQRRMMCTAREQLVASRTALINCVRGWSRTVLLKIASCEPSVFTQRVRTASLKTPDGTPAFVERLLVCIETLNAQIADADKELKQLAEEDPICQRLMSVPGVGPVTSMRFVSAIDENSRFSSAHAVQAFLGLTPGEHSSSERKQRTGITKAGPASVRRTLVQASWNLRRARPHDPISQWAMQIELRRGKFVATVAVARKLAGILFAMWRDGTRYEPQRQKTANAA
jgi:transposase